MDPILVCLESSSQHYYCLPRANIACEIPLQCFNFMKKKEDKKKTPSEKSKTKNDKRNHSTPSCVISGINVSQCKRQNIFIGTMKAILEIFVASEVQKENKNKKQPKKKKEMRGEEQQQQKVKKKQYERKRRFTYIMNFCYSQEAYI